MTASTKISSKGQVVIPKDVRDRYRFVTGEALDVVDRPDGVLLRKRAPRPDASFDEITARIRARVRYEGPPVSIEDMSETISAMWREAGVRG